MVQKEVEKDVGEKWRTRQSRKRKIKKRGIYLVEKRGRGGREGGSGERRGGSGED